MSEGKTRAGGTRSNGLAWKLPIAILLVLALVVVGGRWLHYRLTHVHVIDARVQADMIMVASRLPGWVSEMSLAQGDRISRGQQLVVVDSTDAALSDQVLEAREQTLQAERRQLQAELELAKAQDDSRVARAQHRRAVAEAALQRRQSDLEKAEADLARVRGLADDEMISVQELDDARFALDRASIELRRSQAELAEAESAVTEAQANLLNQQVLEASLLALDARLGELRAERRRAALEVDDRTVRSPIDGVVARTFIHQGEYVQAGQNLMLVHVPGAVWVEANLKETQLAPVREGQPVEIRVDAYRGERLSGRVERIGSAATSEFALLPSPNPSGNFTKTTQRMPVRIALENPEDRLRPGMMVEVSIDIRD
ncbi:MAG: HlyD family secretion protein [Ectothiorhodospiraceae bacterium]|nr:HlyD family secretion protein [Ectothiorhodospiraceae bacterium]